MSRLSPEAIVDLLDPSLVRALQRYGPNSGEVSQRLPSCIILSFAKCQALDLPPRSTVTAEEILAAWQQAPKPPGRQFRPQGERVEVSGDLIRTTVLGPLGRVVVRLVGFGGLPRKKQEPSFIFTSTSWALFWLCGQTKWKGEGCFTS